MSHTPKFARSDSFGNNDSFPKRSSLKTSKKQLKNKENEFMQVASRSLNKLTRPLSVKDKNINQDNEAQFIEQIKLLDQENQRLRDLLKKSNYHQLRRVELSQSTVHDKTCCDSSDILDIDYLDTSLPDISFRRKSEFQVCVLNHSAQKSKNKQSKRTLAGQTVQIERSTQNLAKQYLQDESREKQPFDIFIRSQLLDQSQSIIYDQQQAECAYKQSCEFYKEILMQIIKKDSAIYQNIDKTIQNELDTNFKSNIENYHNQTHFLRGLIDLLEQMIDYFDGYNPQKAVINQFIKEYNTICQQNIALQEKLKIMLIPVNTIANQIIDSHQENLQSQLNQANKALKDATAIISLLTEENAYLKQQNGGLKQDESKVKKRNIDLKKKMLKSGINIESLNEISQQNPEGLLEQINLIRQFMQRLVDKNKRNKLKFKNLQLEIINYCNQDNLDLYQHYNINQLHKEILRLQKK